MIRDPRGRDGRLHELVREVIGNLHPPRRVARLLLAQEPQGHLHLPRVVVGVREDGITRLWSVILDVARSICETYLHRARGARRSDD